jgi:3-oxoadipate enol-lactonase
MADRGHGVSIGHLACHVDGPANAPVLVLLHALATHSEIWRPQLPAWSTAFRVVRIDLPGHGASPAPAGPMDLAAYAAQVGDALDALAIKRATLVGLSLGGMVAQAIALQQPQRVQALVLAHTSARTEQAVREVWQRRLEQFERHGLQQQVGPTLERWFTRTFAAACPLTMDWVAAQIRSTSADGYAAAVRAIQALDHLDRLADIRVPALVIAGDCDAAVPPPMASAMAARLRRAQLLVLDDAGHLGNVQQPLRFAEAAGRFVQQAVNATP